MSEMVDFYQHQAQSRMSSVPMILALQKKALEHFSVTGFPTRHDEDWKYTTIDPFMNHRFQQQDTPDATASQQPKEALPVPSHVCTMYNGQLTDFNHLPSLPKEVIVLPIQQAVLQYPTMIERYLGKILQGSHAFHDLNTLMLSQGLFIYVPKNIVVKDPLWLHHYQDKAENGVYLRHLVVVEANSCLTMIEDYSGADDCCYFTNTITEVALNESSHLQHYKIQREGQKALHVGHFIIQQAASSRCEQHSVSIGGEWVRSDTTIQFSGEQASCLLNGIYLTQEGQHIDQHTEVNHAVPNCQSEQDYKGILQGKSRAVFNGRVIVAKDAQHTRASQKNKNLLCGHSAEIDTKPQLEIFADDVLCSHGTTVGCLDEEALFYLATRGIAKEDAIHYLKKAFLLENMKLVENTELASWIEQLLG